MKKLVLAALLGFIAIGSRAQDRVTVVSDYSYKPHKGTCTDAPNDDALTFTLINPSDCDHPVTVTVTLSSLGLSNFGGVTFTSGGLGYSGYVIVSVEVSTALYPITVGDYTTPLVCSLTPFSSFVTTCCDPCWQYGAQWVYASTSYTGTAYLYLT